MKMRAPGFAMRCISPKFGRAFSRGTSRRLLQTTTNALPSGTGSRSLKAGCAHSALLPSPAQLLLRSPATPARRAPRSSRQGVAALRLRSRYRQDRHSLQAHILDDALLNCRGNFLFARAAQREVRQRLEVDSIFAALFDVIAGTGSRGIANFKSPRRRPTSVRNGHSGLPVIKFLAA